MLKSCTIFISERESRIGGRVILYIHDSLQEISVKFTETIPKIDTVFIGKKKITILLMYATPG